MQMAVPKGRANYEPNSLAQAGEDGGPREDPVGGFRSFQAPVKETKVRLRAATFADHFYPGPTVRPVADGHRTGAPGQRPGVRAVEGDAGACQAACGSANLSNVDETLASRVADGLAMDLPEASVPASEPFDMDESPALRIVGKYPDTLKGRLVGILETDGADGAVVDSVRTASEAGRCPGPDHRSEDRRRDAVGRCQTEGRSPTARLPVRAVRRRGAGPGPTSAARCCWARARPLDFAKEAFGHLKAIGHTAQAQPLLDKAGVQPDAGVITAR